MIGITIKQQIKSILRFRSGNVLSLSGLIIATVICLIILRISLFELSFDKYHKDYKDVYRVENNRVYQNLNDESAGCPPATGPTLLKEVEYVKYAARVKPLTNSILTFVKNNQQESFSHNNLFYADNSIFDIFTFKVVAGNPATALNDMRKAVVTRGFAQKYFGHEDVLNKTFVCKNNESEDEFIVSAIIEDLPANSYFNFDCLFSFKTLEYIERNNRDMSTYWGWNAFNTYVKLEPNSDIDKVHQQFDAVVEKYNLSNNEMTRLFRLQPISKMHLHSNLRHEIGQRNNASSVYILMALAFFILVIAWINHINMSTVKSKKEELEISMKKIFGCRKSDFITKYVFDTVSYNIIALLFSIIIVFLAVPLMKNLFDIELQPLPTNGWLIMLGITFTLALLAGLYSSAANFRTKSVIESKGQGNNRLIPVFRNGFVVFQFIVSIVFIIATGVIIKQVKFMEQQQDEMDMENIVTLRTLSSDNSLKIRQKSFINNIKSISGIEKVSVSNSIPGSDYTNTAGGIRPVGVDADEGIKCMFLETNDEYFDLYGAKLLEGEMLTKQNAGNQQVFMINRTAAKMLGYDNPKDAIGESIIFGELDGNVKTIAGVIDDFYHKSLEEPIYPTIIDYTESGDFISVKYNRHLNNTIVSLLKEQWGTFFPDQPFEYNFNDKYFSDQYYKYRIFSRLVITFALFIIFVSCLGLYSLVRQAITQRIKEIGIRKVNGATVSEVMIMLNSDFVKWVVVAFVFALPFSWLVTKSWLSNFAYKTALSWWIFALGGFLVIGIAILTVCWQSWRAATENPVEALRYE